MGIQRRFMVISSASGSSNFRRVPRDAKARIPFLLWGVSYGDR
jgi:hypothetical protein